MQPFRPEVRARLGELAPLLLDQLDAMTDRMLEGLTRTEPSYRRLMAQGDDDVRATTRAGLERGVRALGDHFLQFVDTSPGKGRAAASRSVGHPRRTPPDRGRAGWSGGVERCLGPSSHLPRRSQSRLDGGGRG